MHAAQAISRASVSAARRKGAIMTLVHGNSGTRDEGHSIRGRHSIPRGWGVRPGSVTCSSWARALSNTRLRRSPSEAEAL
jgi:hypothetical protein